MKMLMNLAMWHRNSFVRTQMIWSISLRALFWQSVEVRNLSASY
jgi:hypothetical protein